MNLAHQPEWLFLHRTDFGEFGAFDVHPTTVKLHENSKEETDALQRSRRATSPGCPQVGVGAPQWCTLSHPAATPFGSSMLRDK